MFELVKTDTNSRARLGRLTTGRGVVETPTFMPVGTQATVKALDPRELREAGAQIVLSNTYHLFLRPGLEVIGKAGGLHRFMGWPYPILTDSGGYQVFSLAKIRKVQDHGVTFQSHVDGTPLFLGPREAMAAQRVLGSDVAMVFDECPPYPASEEAVRAAVDRTIRWARECREQDRAAGQKVFGIVQGGVYPSLRERCAREIVQLEFDGYAIGGLSVGEPEQEIYRAADWAVPHLPSGRPRYAMGLGTPAQIVELVARGVDLFDCVLPTRLARNGTAFTRRGTLNLKNAAFRDDFTPIEEGCGCFACRNFTRAYVRHLIQAKEILGLRLLSLHNSALYEGVMGEIRGHLAAGTFSRYREAFGRDYVPSAKILAMRGEPQSP